jgi:hypothetical protein
MNNNQIVDLILPEKYNKEKAKYDREFWEKVSELNKENFRKMQTSLIVYNKFIFFEDYTVGRESLNFEIHELDLINKQYRLLQEIYYSRLGGK